MATCPFAFIFRIPHSFKTTPIFTQLPLRRHHHNINSTATRARLSMDSPPQGYRRNVGICLINPSKKVPFFPLMYIYNKLFWPFGCFLNCLCMSNFQIFSASRLDIPGSWQMPQVIGQHLLGFILIYLVKVRKIYSLFWKVDKSYERSRL